LRIFIILGTTVFAFKLSRKRRVAFLAGMLLAIDFPLLEAANAILTEISFTAILMIFCWQLRRKNGKTQRPGFSLLAAGVLGGITVLIRPIGVFFFVPMIVYLVLVSPQFRLRAALLLMTGFLCFPTGWALRNHQAVGRYTISTISGFSALQYRAAGALAVDQPGDFRKNFQSSQEQLEARACQEMQRLYARDCSQLTVVERSEYYSRLGSQIVLEHPASYLKVVLRGAAVMMLDGGPTTLSGLAGTSWSTSMRVLLAYTLPVLFFAFYGLVKCWSLDRSFFWMAALVIGYFVVVSAGPEAYARFRVPFLPLYAILTAIGIDSGMKRLSDC
jgi:hypothetical protein